MYRYPDLWHSWFLAAVLAQGTVPSVTVSALKIGSSGRLVELWQSFLRGRGLHVRVTGEFDPATEIATRTFQASQGLSADAVVSNQTLAAAMTLGYPVAETGDEGFPPKPELTLLRDSKITARLGQFPKFRAAPTDACPECLFIIPESPRGVPHWVRDNIVEVSLPTLRDRNLHRTGVVHVHKRVAKSLEALFAVWKEVQLTSRLLSWNGAWSTRYSFGTQKLSMHAWGLAFDVNTRWNPLGTIPKQLGQEGCVRELVEHANKLGWAWGGHFARPDGGHFEATEAAFDADG